MTSSISQHSTRGRSIPTKYWCKLCGKLFCNQFFIEKHLKTHKFPRRRKICFICQKSFQGPSAYNDHLFADHCQKTASGKFMCIICQKEYSTVGGCLVHHREHLPNLQFYCDQCGKGFVRNHLLMKHIQTQHQTSPTRLICEVCGASLLNKFSLSVHMKRHQCKDNYPKLPFSGKCADCSMFYTDLKRHRREAHEDKFQCQICGKVFISEKGLRLHLELHNGEKRFECHICGKRFLLKTLLEQHLRSHPGSGVDPFRCDVCAKTFTRKYKLNDHKNLHTGSKPYECDLCEKTFFSRSSFSRHKRINHNLKNV